MQRFHVHVHVESLDQNIAFYSKLFGAPPARVEADYAKWLLDDPRLNFAISTRGGALGVDHFGFQTDTAGELAALKDRASAADIALLDEGQTTCCYARSDKHWVTDPQGIAWEHFHTLENIATFNEARATVGGSAEGGAAIGAALGAAAEPAAASGAAVQAACCTPQSRGKPVGIAVKAASSCC